MKRSAFVIVFLAACLPVTAQDFEVIVTDDASAAEGCEKVGAVSGKTEDKLIENAKPWRFDLVVLKQKEPKLKGMSYRCREVRVTSNTSVVDGCKFLDNVEVDRSFSAMLGTKYGGIVKDLEYQAWRLGADVLFVIETLDSSATGEAYLCSTGGQDTPAEATPPPGPTSP